ncbi:hypothetical protein PNOK_0055100 [Pyrrhoderma noxium]|uniref:Mini-chromosome maintenance complex-binding protein n=1 Tax=Pyrrhoderma noxium TaxID=2282107 RepID=A0A286UV55_9AGAM|nr:hypothetical protein PNOK_0055100 [Pyrrhoderma noxium]
MVSSTVIDAIASPYDAINDIFRALPSQDKVSEFPLHVSRYFSSVLENSMDQIPLLDTTSNSYRSGSLIRFKGMIQDTSCSPEVYMSSFNETLPGGWGIENISHTEHAELRLDHTKLGERDVVWAVSIPGETQWCKPPHNNTSIGEALTISDSPFNKPHKFPFPDTRHIALQLKIYSSAGLLKPASVHDFVGIFTFDHAHSEFQAESLIPTLHVLFYYPIPKTLLPNPLSTFPNSQAMTIRESIITWLSNEALGCDRNAAEWILLSCLSSMESREPPLFPMSIVLSRFPRETGIPTLKYLLEAILPLFHFLPLSLSFLNEQKFQPESIDEDLHSAIFQVPSSSTFLITEAGIEEGNLTAKGTENARAIQEVAKSQNLRYKFPFNEYSFPTDITLITLTDGKESLFLKSEIHVPLKSSPSDLYRNKDSIEWPPEEILNKFRDYILRGKNIQRPNVDASVSTHIKNEFVSERQKNSSYSPDDLIFLMTIAKNIAISKLEHEMTLDSWVSAKALYTQRKTGSN